MILEDGQLYMRVFSSKVRAVLLSHPVVSKGLFTLIKISLGYNTMFAALSKKNFKVSIPYQCFSVNIKI